MRSFVLALAAAGLMLVACGGAADTNGTTPRNRASKQRDAKTTQADYEDENSVGMSQQRVSRWRWKGARKDCFYVVGNKCYRTEKAACSAAGCTKRSDCEIDDGAPMNVSCPSAKRSRKQGAR